MLLTDFMTGFFLWKVKPFVNLQNYKDLRYRNNVSDNQFSNDLLIMFRRKIAIITIFEENARPKKHRNYDGKEKNNR